MQSLDESVVQEEHEGGSPPCPSLTPEEHLANVADILDFRVAQTEFPVTLSDQSSRSNFVPTYQRTNEVYRTRPATTTVKIRPGTKPKVAYEYGNDMIAKQMYSENNNAAV
jgi:hypothetical protein